MDHSYTSDQSENETKGASVSDTSKPKVSRKKGGGSITPEVRLRIFQQAAYDCQEAGYTVKVLAVNGGIAVVVLGTQLVDGQIVPIPTANTAKNE